ncbi:FAD-binding oxidoreductase [Alcaligenaceae bacterium A4P071]|nr:FAD-binding oxidoreductase [Alcaligenaceae bacterium A4P071]
MERDATLTPHPCDVVVAGAGLIGLACAHAALREGLSVAVIDRDFEGDRASHGNAGGIAVSESTPISVPGLFFKAAKWLIDPLGPLSVSPAHLPRALPWFLAFNRVSRPQHYAAISHALAALNHRVYDDLLPVLEDLGMRSALYRRGALTVYESDAAFAADSREWAFKRELGVRWHALGGADLRALEPALAPVFKHAVMLEDWAHLSDPRALVTAWRARVVALGATLIRGDAEHVDVSRTQAPAVVLTSGQRVGGRQIVVACGAWSATLAKSVGDRVLLDSERGYNTTLPESAATLAREVIFAERKFVATPLDIGLRIGGAAEFAGLSAPPNYRRADALMALGRRFIPGLNEQGATRWMGHRPATPDSLPVIGRSPHADAVVYAFGHGHLGLTQSATTGALVADVLMRRTPRVDLAPYAISRFSP